VEVADRSSGTVGSRVECLALAVADFYRSLLVFRITQYLAYVQRVPMAWTKVFLFDSTARLGAGTLS
jgi:hypothetical protein